MLNHFYITISFLKNKSCWNDSIYIKLIEKLIQILNNVLIIKIKCIKCIIFIILKIFWYMLQSLRGFVFNLSQVFGNVRGRVTVLFKTFGTTPKKHKSTYRFIQCQTFLDNIKYKFFLKNCNLLSKFRDKSEGKTWNPGSSYQHQRLIHCFCIRQLFSLKYLHYPRI